MFELDLIHTLAFAGIVLLAGYRLRRAIPILDMYNIPAPVVGGLVIAIATLVARSCGLTLIRVDTTLQSPLMVAFFTSIGFAASLSILRAGSGQVIRFFTAASVFAVVQNIAGILVALAFGMAPLFGVLVGSVTLTGGPATGLAFAPLFEGAGVTGAGSIAIAAAMSGVVAGGVVGGPLATLLIRRHGLKPSGAEQRGEVTEIAMPEATGRDEVDSRSSRKRKDAEDVHTLDILKNIVAILVAMWIGSWLSRGFAAIGLTLPAYVGAMIVAGCIRNLDETTGWLRLSYRFIDAFGAVALSLFIVMALITLKLWELAGVALPLIAILFVQIALAGLIAGGPVFRLMGRDYESAVMSGGFLGFMLGTTANSMAVMQALVERYGPAPRAFVVAPIVGAFFLDFTNALIITAFLNLFS